MSTPQKDSTSGHEPRKGSRVRYTASQLGAMESPNAGRFHPHIVNTGDTGIYDSPHELLDEWHITTIVHEGATLYVPVHLSQFEVMPDA